MADEARSASINNAVDEALKDFPNQMRDLAAQMFAISRDEFDALHKRFQEAQQVASVGEIVQNFKSAGNNRATEIAQWFLDFDREIQTQNTPALPER